MLQTVATFFSQVMAAVGGNTAGPGIVFPFTNLVEFCVEKKVYHRFLMFFAGDAVVNVYINYEKKFAFVEMRTVEEASNAMSLDGIMFEV